MKSGRNYWPSTPLVGIDGLAVAILRQAADDYRSRNAERRRDAYKFFTSDWYLEILDGLGLPPDAVPVVVDDVDGYRKRRLPGGYGNDSAELGQASSSSE